MKRIFVIADERLPSEQREKLLEFGFTPILLPPSEKLSSAVASHPDMLMFLTKDTLITERDYYGQNANIINEITGLCKMRTVISSTLFEKEYPNDAIFNAGVTSDKVFIKTDSIAKEVIDYANSASLTLVAVKQGYPACTVLFLGDKFAVTSDKGMAKILEKSEISTTIIDNSPKILLPPYEYGFIGGCAGIYRDTVYFTGNLDAHPDKKKIKSAISKAGFKYISLGTGESLFDLGGLRFLEEAVDNDCKNRE